MTRITFQFVPASYVDSGDVSLQKGSVEGLDVESQAGGSTVVKTRDAKIEFDRAGNIRYSVDKEEVGIDTVESVYDSAIEVLDRTLEKDEQEYRVSLIIGEMESFRQYFDHRGEISEFGSNKFSSEDPEYTELSDHSVKISFSGDGQAVRV